MASEILISQDWFNVLMVDSAANDVQGLTIMDLSSRQISRASVIFVMQWPSPPQTCVCAGWSDIDIIATQGILRSSCTLPTIPLPKRQSLSRHTDFQLASRQHLKLQKRRSNTCLKFLYDFHPVVYHQPTALIASLFRRSL